MKVILINSMTEIDSCKVVDEKGNVLFEGNQRECDDYIMENI